MSFFDERKENILFWKTKYSFHLFEGEKLDSKQIEALEEVFKRLSFKTIDLELSQFEDDSTAATLFEILDYYDTCEKLILANNKSISVWGWQSLSKYIRKVINSTSYKWGTLFVLEKLFPKIWYFS